MKRMVVVKFNWVWYTIDSINKGLYRNEKTVVIRFPVHVYADGNASVRFSCIRLGGALGKNLH